MTNYVPDPLICMGNVITYLFLVYSIVLFHHVMMEVTDFTTLLATKLRTHIFQKLLTRSLSNPWAICQLTARIYRGLHSKCSYIGGARRGRKPGSIYKVMFTYSPSVPSSSRCRASYIYVIQTNCSQLYQQKS